jgi:hypothetical protein
MLLKGGHAAAGLSWPLASDNECCDYKNDKEGLEPDENYFGLLDEAMPQSHLSLIYIPSALARSRNSCRVCLISHHLPTFVRLPVPCTTKQVQNHNQPRQASVAAVIVSVIPERHSRHVSRCCPASTEYGGVHVHRVYI